jgi:hypothetical protein
MRSTSRRRPITAVARRLNRNVRLRWRILSRRRRQLPAQAALKWCGPRRPRITTGIEARTNKG